MNNKLNALNLGYAAGIVSAGCMLVLSVLGKMGFYMGAVEMMQKWHMFFSLDIMGIVAGMIEAAIISFITVYLFGLVYNQLSSNKE